MRDEMERVLAEYPSARSDPLTDHPLARLLTRDLADEARESLANDSYLVTGSPGRGNWAETPWLAIFDRLVTETAQRGFYVVYLFRGDGAAVTLSLNQGTTEVLQLVGRSNYLDELTTRAKSFNSLLAGQDASGLDVGPVDLGGSGDLTRGYEAGSIVSTTYTSGALPEEDVLQADLDRMLLLYATLVQTRDALVEDADPAAVDASSESIEEAMKERWHRRSERNPKLTKAAKEYHGTTCVVCGFNFEETYGEIGKGYIEAHHLTPFSELKGRPTKLDPKADFAVLCPNCHRMLHKVTPPLTPSELRDRIASIDIQLP
jgi:5-methylcytosine-specific restriction protein A